MTPASPATEQHYTVPQIADLWGVSPQTVTRLFRDRPGVLAIARPVKTLRPRGKARARVTLRIPASVLEAAHAERSRGWR